MIIPVYNEVKNIEVILARIAAINIKKQIIVVDDFSTDGTRDLIKDRKDINVFLHNRNMGKGAAIRTGLEQVQGDVTIIQDADLEYSPVDYYRLLKQIQTNQSQVVYGSRILGNGDFLIHSYLANRLLTFLTNVLFNARITDMETCYKMIKSDLLKNLGLISRRFEIEPEITCKILKRGEDIIEIPISYSGRREGKKIGILDGIQAIWNIVKWKFLQ